MEAEETKEASAKTEIKTLNCLLCGGTQIYPGPRYKNHLINEHGAIFDVEFLIELTIFKKEKSNLPDLKSQNDSNEASKANPEVSLKSVKENGDVEEAKSAESALVKTSCVEVQTDFENLCSKCKENPAEVNADPEANGLKSEFMEDEEDEDDYDDVMGRLVMDLQEEDEEIDLDSQGALKVWPCPACPHVFNKENYFKTHVVSCHDLTQDEIESTTTVEMSEEDYLKRKEAADQHDEEEQAAAMANKNGDGPNSSLSNSKPTFALDKAKRKPIGKDWGPNSFSSTFTCYFCSEQFRKDYRLKLHLMLNHKDADPAEMAKAKEVLTKSKLDGCVHRCAMCGSKYNSVANFTRHIKDVHQMSRALYREQHGSSEVIIRMFKCELCDKEVKHTRNIIGAHMKMVHLISWREYQEILVRLRRGESVGDYLPSPELFECAICGVSVKYKREHLSKKHQINEDTYDELIDKKNRGEVDNLSEVLPEREVFKCLICDRECMDLKKHIERSHQIGEDVYEEMAAARNAVEAGKRGSSLGKISNKRVSYEMTPSDSVTPPGGSSPSGVGGSFSSGNNNYGNSGSLSTDLQCYFGCDESFKKDYQLNLHLRLKHRHEDPEELAKAYDAAEEEIALTRRSASIFNCALCPKTFNDNGAFYGHIQTKHNMVWRDYKEQYGRCEVESAPFECKICGRVVKYDRNTVHTHLKNVHGINWAMYLDRIRRMRRGEVPEDLPAPETFECKVCNVNVKYLKEHLKNAHKITEHEYESLFGEEESFKQPPKSALPRPPPLTPKPRIMGTTSLTMTPVSRSATSAEAGSPAATADMPSFLTAFDPSLPKPPKSDIQDKTNKTCSSCTITFDSRRSFIEHCTTVHNMRFKTKSGATISGNTVQKRLQDEAMKRKLEIERQTQQTLKRKAEVELQFNGGGQSRSKKANMEMPVIVENSGKRTLYTPSGVSKWNQCKYECCFCKRTTMSRSSMTSHIHNTHGIPIKEYKESNYPDIEVETNWFQCRLCPARTKFVKDCIAPHLKMSHNMDIEEYEQTIMQPEDWPYQVIPEPSLKHEIRKSVAAAAAMATASVNIQAPPKINRVSSLAKRSSRPPPPASNGGVHANLMNDNIVPTGPINTERDKWNRCKFSCGLCELITVDSRQMRLHIATQHGHSMEEYTRQYGTTEIVTKKFRCELCGSEMKFCRQNIYAHMKDVHKITLMDYETQIGTNANDILAVEDMDGGAAVGQQVQPMTEEVDGGEYSAQQHHDEEIIVDGIDPTTVPVPQGDDYVDSGVLDDGKKPSRWNKCRFRCALCGKLSSEKRHVREHIIKVHGLSLPEYEAQYGDCEIHTEYFFCGVCHAEVKHNLKNISLHLQNVHNMSPGEYEQQYGAIPDEEAEMPDTVEPATMIEENDSASLNFGSHFLYDDNSSVEQYDNPLDESSIGVTGSSLPNPPKSDIQDPRNKYCQPCERDFNRRQAFVEHCRTVHNMKIKFAKSNSGGGGGGNDVAVGGAGVLTPKVSRPPPFPKKGSAATGYPCQYCGKSFSNQSNRRRHTVLSCEIARQHGVEPRKPKAPVIDLNAKRLIDNQQMLASQSSSFVETSLTITPSSASGKKIATLSASSRRLVNSSTNDPNANVTSSEAESPTDPLSSEMTPQQKAEAIMSDDFYYEEGLPGSRPVPSEPEKCPFPECNVTHVRSALMKRHLSSVHNVGEAATSKSVKIKKEVMDESDQDATDRKVPPLRVKISQVRSDSNDSSNPASPSKTVAKSPHEAKPYVTCPSCNEFRSNNLYILGRHQKSCEKKMEQRVIDTDANNDNEETTEADFEEEAEDNDNDTTIEVAVDFEEQDQAEVEEDDEAVDGETLEQELAQEEHESSNQSNPEETMDEN